MKIPKNRSILIIALGILVITSITFVIYTKVILNSHTASLSQNLTPHISNETAYYKNNNLDAIRRQFANIGMIRTALANYAQQSGSFPLSLSDLSKNTGGKVFLDSIPNDLFTNQQFEYKKTADRAYILKYQMKFIEPMSDEELRVIVSSTNQGSDGVSYTKPTITMGFIEGVNTIDQTVERPSFEAKVQNAIDTDNDGAPDYLESLIDLDKNNPDSNGDEVDDGTEILKRVNGQPYF